MVEQAFNLDVEASMSRKPWTPDTFHRMLALHTDHVSKSNIHRRRMAVRYSRPNFQTYSTTLYICSPACFNLQLCLQMCECQYRNILCQCNLLGAFLKNVGTPRSRKLFAAGNQKLSLGFCCNSVFVQKLYLGTIYALMQL